MYICCKLLERDNKSIDNPRSGLARLSAQQKYADARDVRAAQEKRTGEKLFDAYKNVLDADGLYLQDDESVFGHVFISFLSLYAYCKLEEMLKKADLSRNISPCDLLLQYSKVYHVKIGDRTQISEVPNKVRDLDSKLGLNLFPTA